MSHTKLYLSDFASLFGIGKDILEYKNLVDKYNFTFRFLETEEKNQLILRILKRIDSPDLHIAGLNGRVRWIRDWQEILNGFVASDYDVNELIPKFIRPNQPIRLFGDYVMPENKNFELDFYRVYRNWLFGTYFAPAAAIYEFGCGTAFNLVELARMYPEKILHGFEWVTSPIEIMRFLRERHGYNITGHLFDMFFPDRNLEIVPGSAFLAIGALEQIGKNFNHFLDFVLEKKPSVFVHVDSLTELYDENNLSDYLALKHDIKRNYLQGYLTRLRELEKEGRVEIIKVQKVSCGGLYHDGYSHIIWRPTGG